MTRFCEKRIKAYARDRFWSNIGAKPGEAKSGGAKSEGAKPGGIKPKRPSLEGVVDHCSHLE